MLFHNDRAHARLRELAHNAKESASRTNRARVKERERVRTRMMEQRKKKCTQFYSMIFNIVW